MKTQKYLESKSLSLLLFGFIFLLYAMVYMTKSMFSSAMAIIVEEGVMTKSQAGLINAAFWLVYAVFQVFGGFAADKYSPYKLIMIGMIGAAAANMVIYFNQSYGVIMVVWSLSAVVQFGLWPGIFKIVSTQLMPSLRRTAVFWMLFATSLGLGVSLLVASFVSHWKDNFLISAISLLAGSLLYTVLQLFLDKRMVEEEIPLRQVKGKTKNAKAPMMSLLFSTGLIVFLFLSFFRTALDNGVKMMTPVMLMESYPSLPAAISTRLSSILIIFSAIGLFGAGIMQSKVTKNEAKAQIIFYGLSFLPLLIACFVGQIHYFWVLVALSFAILVIHAAGPFNQTYVALHFESYGRIGTVSGILNATASVGNVFASYVFAKMAETMPWGGIVTSWLLATIFCVLLCVAVLPRWTRFIKKEG